MIYLHIGSGKAGSTTIQSFLEHNQSVLEANGLMQPDVDIHHLATVLSAAGSKEAELNKVLSKLREALDGKSAGTFVFSSEFLFMVNDRKRLALLRDVTSKHAVKLIVYMREYPGWLTSAYNQTIKKGKAVWDFDDYFERKIPQTSVLPTIQAWADVFGRGNLRIRSIDAPSLTSGKLTVDFANAIGVEEVGELELDVPSKNASEDWYNLEARRGLASELRRRDVRDLANEFTRLAGWIHRLMPAAMRQANSTAGKIQYLTPDQWRRARDLYNADVRKLREDYPTCVVAELHGGVPRERDFLPSLDHIPVGVRQALFASVRQAALEHKMPVEDAELLESMLIKVQRAPSASEESEKKPSEASDFQSFSVNPLERRELDEHLNVGAPIFLSGPRQSATVKVVTHASGVLGDSSTRPAKYVFSATARLDTGLSPELFVAGLSDVRIATNRYVVVDKNAALVAETVPRNARPALIADRPGEGVSRKPRQSRAPALFRPLAARIRSSLAGPRILSLEEPTAMVGQANNNYGHWHMDVLSSVGLLQTLGLDQQVTLLTSELIPYRRRSLELMGVDLGRVREVRPADLEGSHVHCRCLVVPSLMSVNYGHVPPWQQNVYDRIRVALLREAEELTVSFPKKIYVDRSNVSKRKCLNEPELAERLKNHGFTIIEPQRLTYDEQVLAFAKADVIVGCMGAGMMNVVFAQRGASVIEVVPPGYHNRYLWKKFASMAGAHHQGIMVPPGEVEDDESGEQWSIPDVDALSAEILRLA